MIKVSYSRLFQNDLESVIDWLHSFAIRDGKSSFKIVEDFRQELTEQVSGTLSSNPLTAQAIQPDEQSYFLEILFSNISAFLPEPELKIKLVKWF